MSFKRLSFILEANLAVSLESNLTLSSIPEINFTMSFPFNLTERNLILFKTSLTHSYQRQTLQCNSWQSFSIIKTKSPTLLCHTSIALSFIRETKCSAISFKTTLSLVSYSISHTINTPYSFIPETNLNVSFQTNLSLSLLLKTNIYPCQSRQRRRFTNHLNRPCKSWGGGLKDYEQKHRSAFLCAEHFYYQDRHLFSCVDPVLLCYRVLNMGRVTLF